MSFLVTPAARSLFDDLTIKPQNAFDKGLFRRRREGKLGAGASFPRAWVRGRLPWGGVALLRPDRCVFAEGTLTATPELVRTALGIVQGADTCS
ncbi:hypothetical protein [Variovorax sp. HW608]|uniref:hypothetical protein n=1 Tax=Variovorax sp. HW608 TaxID=1034889 RepID=UPI0012FDE503|nr:hypothetical protein [Variovorax sp. HW608]